MPKGTKKKKNRKQHREPPPQKKQKAPQPSPEEVRKKKQIAAFDTTSNKYTDVINKKIRNVNKKLAKIEALEQKDPKELNDDQRSSIARREPLEAERARLEDIQRDLICQALNDCTGEEEVQPAPVVAGPQVTALIKLNSVTRLSLFDDQNLADSAQKL